jgi:5-methylcytosine-specific restriction enzyme subunit McrC
MTSTKIMMREWQESFHENVLLPDEPAVQHIVQSLSQSGKLFLEERRKGTVVRATSFVGRVTLGTAEITVQPKIQGMPLMRLLQYAYRLHQLNCLDATEFGVASSSFLDLVIAQFVAETEELTRRGLRREYVRCEAWLASPRGKIDIQRFARHADTGAASLPCIFAPRLDDTSLNRVLQAGLRLAIALVTSPELLRTLHAQHQLLAQDIATIRLDCRTLAHARRSCNRLTASYQPVLTLIELLFEMQSVVLEADDTTVTVPGFLFDMNRFFQTLLSRFLHENLSGYSVHDETNLRDMMEYDPNFNPRRRSAPVLRPDFLIVSKGQTVALLDAKYRDLWERNLPREMLYQLAMYALSRREKRTAVILYPTLDAEAKEARINIHDPQDAHRTAQVILRPVDLTRLAHLVSDARSVSERRDFAVQLAFSRS